jgi:hypothetical protein
MKKYEITQKRKGLHLYYQIDVLLDLNNTMPISIQSLGTFKIKVRDVVQDSPAGSLGHVFIPVQLKRGHQYMSIQIETEPGKLSRIESLLESYSEGEEIHLAFELETYGKYQLMKDLLQSLLFKQRLKAEPESLAVVHQFRNEMVSKFGSKRQTN